MSKVLSSLVRILQDSRESITEVKTMRLKIREGLEQNLKDYDNPRLKDVGKKLEYNNKRIQDYDDLITRIDKYLSGDKH